MELTSQKESTRENKFKQKLMVVQMQNQLIGEIKKQ